MNQSKRSLILQSILALFLGIGVFLIPTDYIEFLFYDAKFRLSQPTPTSGHIQTIAIDKKTLDYFNKNITLQEHLKFIEKVKKVQPLAIVYTVDPSKVSGSTSEKVQWLTLLRETKSFYYAYPDLIPIPGDTDTKLKAPFDFINSSPGFIPIDSGRFADDSVARRVIISYKDQKLLHTQLAELVSEARSPEKYRGAFKYYDSIHAFADYRPKGTYQHISLVDILEGEDLSFLKNKIIILGEDAFIKKANYVKSIYSREISALSKLEAQANLIDTLIQNKGITFLPSWINILCTIIISFISVFVIFRFRPLKGISTLLVMGILFFVLSLGIFFFGRTTLDVDHPLLTIFICYYFFIPYRLIRENQKSWEYQQKNELLTQVEELKTNFLGMMSHDLKTPLARIQGMLDVALQNPQNLSEKQIEALKTIGQSCDELTQFISSILDLSRIESKKIKLQTATKDINTLIENTVLKYKHLAKDKNIKITTQLEPLFGFKFDDILIKQVLSNLIENAIKYSPAGTEIHVSTKEIQNHVNIQVSDQGFGISQDELDKIFMKFYRSKEAKNTPIKGSGLGLYLAKYFVELHQGRLKVESTLGQGATFSVELPIE